MRTTRAGEPSKSSQAEWQCYQIVVSFLNLREIEEFNDNASLAEELTMNGSIASKAFNRWRINSDTFNFITRDETCCIYCKGRVILIELVSSGKRCFQKKPVNAIQPPLQMICRDACTRIGDIKYPAGSHDTGDRNSIDCIPISQVMKRSIDMSTRMSAHMQRCDNIAFMTLLPEYGRYVTRIGEDVFRERACYIDNFHSSTHSIRIPQ